MSKKFGFIDFGFCKEYLDFNFNWEVVGEHDFVKYKRELVKNYSIEDISRLYNVPNVDYFEIAYENDLGWGTVLADPVESRYNLYWLDLVHKKARRICSHNKRGDVISYFLTNLIGPNVKLIHPDDLTNINMSSCELYSGKFLKDITIQNEVIEKGEHRFVIVDV